MEATLRPYDRGEEVTPFATLGRAREPTRSLAGWGRSEGGNRMVEVSGKVVRKVGRVQGA